MLMPLLLHFLHADDKATQTINHSTYLLLPVGNTGFQMLICSKLNWELCSGISFISVTFASVFHNGLDTWSDDSRRSLSPMVQFSRGVNAVLASSTPNTGIAVSRNVHVRH